MYEGCKTYNSTYWKCGYRADQHWSWQTSTAGIQSYYYPAFKDTKIVAKAKCA